MPQCSFGTSGYPGPVRSSSAWKPGRERGLLDSRTYHPWHRRRSSAWVLLLLLDGSHVRSCLDQPHHLGRIRRHRQETGGHLGRVCPPPLEDTAHYIGRVSPAPGRDEEP